MNTASTAISALLAANGQARFGVGNVHVKQETEQREVIDKAEQVWNLWIDFFQIGS